MTRDESENNKKLFPKEVGKVENCRRIKDRTGRLAMRGDDV